MIEGKHFPKIGLVLVIGLYLFFGLSHLGQFVTADENKWLYERIPNYWEAIHDHKWKKTFINDKPGVSIALMGLPAIKLYPDSREFCKEGEDRIIQCDTANAEHFLIAFRLPLILINGALLILLFFVLGRLINPWVALWSAALIGLSPPLMGISQIVNPDAFLWSFGSVATFAFFLTLQTGEKKWSVLSGLLLGMALLSKYTALILYPFFFGVLVLGFLLSENKESSRLDFIRNLKLWCLLGVVALVTTCLFLPAFLVSPGYFIGKYLFSIGQKGLLMTLGLLPLIIVLGDTFLFRSRGMLFFKQKQVYLRDTMTSVVFVFGLMLVTTLFVRRIFSEWEIFRVLPFDTKELSSAIKYGVELNFFEAWLLEWSPLAFSLTPAVLLGVAFLCVFAWKHRQEKLALGVVTSAIFVFLYLGILVVTDVFTTIRYSIILYPFVGFLAAMGFWYLSERINFKGKYFWITGLILSTSCASLFLIKPFYLNYTSDLLPKKDILSDAWGYGGYEAAMYLNSLPDAKNLTVWADYYGVCEFFVGKCLTAYTYDGTNIKLDYYVFTRRGRIRYWSRYTNWERTSGLTAYKYYDDKNPAWELSIDNRPLNQVRVVKNSEEGGSLQK
ncbi:MAG: glycosyltransferase family 39 protein [Candidatus Moranbacteria bacterium]|nr:glycosyltransferase family 39 protein [Candidatus Moranbacteria bacterium]